MRAVAHGWRKPGGGGPSRSVAREFVNADRKWTGGLAAMNEINSGVAKTLNFQTGGPVPLTDQARIFELSHNPGTGDPNQAIDLSDWRHTGGGRAPMTTRDTIALLEAQGYVQGEGYIWNPPGGTILAPGGTSSTTPPAPAPIPIDMESPDDLMLRAVREDQGWTYDPSSSTMRPPETTVPGVTTTPPRIIPGAVGTQPAGPPPLTPEQRAARTAERRETPYRQQLRAHQARVVSALNPGPQPLAKPVGRGNMMSGQMVPPGAIGGDLQNPIYGARGGRMNYQAGGEVAAPPIRRTPVTGGGPAIAGHSEGTNPFLPGEKRYEEWEEKYHWVDDTAPMPSPDERGGLIAWLLDTLGYGNVEAAATRSETELTELGEARGGRVGRYQVGGLAQAQGRRGGGFRPPRGGVPPSMRGLPPRAGGIPPRMAPSAAPAGQRFAGGSPGFYAPGGPGRGGGAQADLGPGGGGIPGGARVPPNIRGHLQKQRMMNRPPANVGGGVNRVGQQDQQGGLARALQRGTGRPPMSRRAGFPGR